VKIAIIGAGNIGSLLGALLVQAGQDVTLVELRKEVIEAIGAEGITVDMSDGTTVHSMVNITDDVNVLEPPDLIILAVKSTATRAAMMGARALVGPDTWVLTVQNGAGNVETVVEVLGDDSWVIGGVFWCNVTPVALNHLSWVVGTGGLKIAPANGFTSTRTFDIADVFRNAGVDVAVSDDVQRLIWSKVLQNVPLAIGTAMRLTNDEYAAYPHARELIMRMAEECVAVAQRAGITLDPAEDPIGGLLDTIQKFHDSGRKPKCSMLQDIELGRLTEIDAINGSIVREGKRLGVPTPVNEVMVALVKVQEEKNCA
jgi:2-dehydropantoate 2-reductase